MLRNKQLHEIVPTRNSTGASFSGELRIEWTIPVNNILVNTESYTLFRVNLANIGAGPGFALTAVTLPDQGFAQLPASCLFDQITLKHNDVVAERIDEVTSTLSLIGFIDRDYCSNEKNFQANPLLPLEENYTYYYNNTNPTADEYQRRKFVTEMKVGTSNDYLFKLDWPFMRGVNELDAGKITLLFQIAPDWLTKILFYANAVTPQQNKLASDGSGPEGTYGYVQDIKHYAMMYEAQNPPRGEREFMYDSVVAVPKNINVGDGVARTVVERVEIPVATNFICLCFKVSADNTTNQSSYFNPANVATRLTSLSIKFGGLTYPQYPFSFSTDGTTNGLLAGSTQDCYRAYQDYLIATGMLKVGALQSYREWLRNPIFCWRVVRAPGDMSTTATVTMVFRATGGDIDADFMLACFETHSLSYDVNDNGLASNTIVKTIST